MEQIEKYFIENKKNNFENIENFIEIRNSNFFINFLEFITLNKKISIFKQNEILENFRNKLIEISLNYSEKLDEFIISNLVSFQRMKNENFLNEILNFIKFINLIRILTKNLNVTNQIMSNCINQINKILDLLLISENYNKINENIIIIIKIIEINIEIILNINCYNPKLIMYLNIIINFLIENKEKKIEIINKENKIEYSFNNNNNNNLNFIHSKISNLINIYSSHLINDINYDILFENLYNSIKILNNNNEEYNNFINTYESILKKIKIKKIFPMNFLILKPKCIQTLEPDYDLSFLGEEFINLNEKNKRMERILKHKLKDTQKQAVRKLKKEAKIIDKERQIVINKINEKRKEEQKITNQFLEQENIAYKKMMSSNMRKRYKFKKHKNK
jgi:hypothetical protein